MSFDSLTYKRFGQTSLPCGLSQGKLLTIYFEEYILPGVIVLFRSCRPPAVILAVWAVCVPAINRKLWAWPWSHISDKYLKTTSPFIANCYTSTPIACKRWILWVQTALFYASPATILASVATAVSITQTSIPGFPHQASTAIRGSTQSVAWHNRFLSTIAETPPHCESGVRHTCNDNQAPKSLACQINQLAHISIIEWRKAFGNMVLGFQAVEERLEYLEAENTEMRAENKALRQEVRALRGG